MSLTVLALIVIIIRLIKNTIDQNTPYYGTSRDIFKNNPAVLENRRRVAEICDRQRKEYEKRTGNKANW